jgi:hypothetical protein
MEGVYSTGSGILISPGGEVFKRGRYDGLPEELLLTAVWKEPLVLGQLPNKNPESVSIAEKSSVTDLNSKPFRILTGGACCRTQIKISAQR